MNITLHPGHWFHHQHLHKAEEQGSGMRWSEVFHSEVFWILALLTAVLVPLIILALLFGATSPSNGLPMVYRPMW